MRKLILTTCAIILGIYSSIVVSDDQKQPLSDCSNEIKVQLYFPNNPNDRIEIIKFLEYASGVQCLSVQDELRIDCYKCCLKQVPDGEICKDFKYGQFERDKKCDC